MPFTVGYLQRTALRGWGRWLPQKRAAAAINELKRKKILTPVGFYKSRRHGYCVTLYSLARSSSSVGKRRAVKAWWKHPLFGFGQPSYPKQYPRRLQKWKEAEHWLADEW